MIPLPEYADWFLLTCVAAAVSTFPLWKWWKLRQESAVAESWDKFNGFMAFVEKGKRTARGGFATTGMLLLMVGLSLPAITMILGRYHGLGIYWLTAAVAVASAGAVVCVLTGNKLSNQARG